MQISRTTNASLLLAGALAVACGDDDGRNGGDGNIDTGELDASMLGDGSLDAALNDAGDSGGGRSADAGPTVVCSFARSELLTVAKGTVSASDPIALTVRNDGASLSWIEYESAVPRVNSSWFSSDKQSLYTPLDDGGSSTQSEPANAATASGFLTVWTDDLGDGAGGIDIHAQGWGPDGHAVAPLGTKLTSDGSATIERVPALARGADGNVLLVYQSAGVARGTSLLLDATGSPIGQPHKLDNFGPQTSFPVLAALGANYVLAWVDPVALRVHMLRLDATGTPIGNDVLVDVEQNAYGTVDLATTAAGGAIVFDVYVGGARPEIRFHTFDATGVLTGQEVVVSNVPNTGSVPSIVPLAGGYAVAYRSVKMPDLQVRLVLLDAYGVVTNNLAVAPILDSTLPVALRIAPDGKQMFLGWTDRLAGSGAHNLQRTWVTCD